MSIKLNKQETHLEHRFYADSGKISETLKATIDKFLDGDLSKDSLADLLKPALHGDEPISGIVMTDTGEKKSIFKVSEILNFGYDIEI